MPLDFVCLSDDLDSSQQKLSWRKILSISNSVSEIVSLVPRNSTGVLGLVLEAAVS